MNLTKDFRKTYANERQGYFIFDADYWYTEIFRKATSKAPDRKLTKDEKIKLAEFLLKDICSTYSEAEKAELVHSMEEHHYDSVFHKPFVVENTTDVITGGWYNNKVSSGHLDYLNDALDDENYAKTANGNFKGTKFNIIETRDGQTPSNPAGKYIGKHIGRVVIPHKHNVNNFSLITAILTRVTCNFTLPKNSIKYFTL